MKKLFSFLVVIIVVFAFAPHSLAENTMRESREEWEKGEISFLPKLTEEQLAKEREATRWVHILENEVGVYTYDRYSLNIDTAEKKRIAAVTVKTIFTNADLKKKFKEQYEKVLKKHEAVESCLMIISFDLDDKTYAVLKTEVYSDKGRQIDEHQNKGNFSPVPEQSFAEAMLEIAEQYAAEAKESK